jgi:hypothetical protein
MLSNRFTQSEANDLAKQLTWHGFAVWDNGRSRALTHDEMLAVTWDDISGNVAAKTWLVYVISKFGTPELIARASLGRAPASWFLEGWREHEKSFAATWPWKTSLRTRSSGNKMMIKRETYQAAERIDSKETCKS